MPKKEVEENADLRILNYDEFVEQGNQCTVFPDAAERLAAERQRQPVDPMFVNMSIHWAIVADQSAGHLFADKED